MCSSATGPGVEVDDSIKPGKRPTNSLTPGLVEAAAAGAWAAGSSLGTPDNLHHPSLRLKTGMPNDMHRLANLENLQQPVSGLGLKGSQGFLKRIYEAL